MILTALFSTLNGSIFQADIYSGRVIRIRKPTFLQSSDYEPIDEETKNELIGEILEPMYGDLAAKALYIILCMENGELRLFPVRRENKDLFIEHRDYFKENRISDYKSTIEFLRL